MKNDNRYVGLDVHAETIAVAVVETDGEVRFLGAIPNRAETVRRLVEGLGPGHRGRFCFEGGAAGGAFRWGGGGAGGRTRRGGAGLGAPGAGGWGGGERAGAGG